jgi:hypothetical protein
MKDFSCSFSYFDISLRFRVSFFLDCFRIKDSIGKEMAPSFITKRIFSVRVLSLE